MAGVDLRTLSHRPILSGCSTTLPRAHAVGTLVVAVATPVFLLFTRAMHLTAYADYALRVLTYLARRPDRPVTSLRLRPLTASPRRIWSRWGVGSGWLKRLRRSAAGMVDFGRRIAGSSTVAHWCNTADPSPNRKDMQGSCNGSLRHRHPFHRADTARCRPPPSGRPASWSQALHGPGQGCAVPLHPLRSDSRR